MFKRIRPRLKKAPRSQQRINLDMVQGSDNFMKKCRWSGVVGRSGWCLDGVWCYDEADSGKVKPVRHRQAVCLSAAAFHCFHITMRWPHIWPCIRSLAKLDRHS